MNRPKEERMKRPSSALCLFVLWGGICLTACGSGGGNVPPTMGGAMAATFTPANQTPGINSISMQPGAATGATFEVIVNVTDIVDFFGAAFRIGFDSTTAEFLSSDDSTSFLHNHPEILMPPPDPLESPGVIVQATVDPTDSGNLLVVATFVNTLGYSPGFTPPANDQVLLTLTFRATNATAGNAFTFDTTMTREVQTCEPRPMIGPGNCMMVSDGNLTWNGGTLTAN
jgi:hypothetical protein